MHAYLIFISERPLVEMHFEVSQSQHNYMDSRIWEIRKRTSQIKSSKKETNCIQFREELGGWKWNNNTLSSIICIHYALHHNILILVRSPKEEKIEEMCEFPPPLFWHHLSIHLICNTHINFSVLLLGTYVHICIPIYVLPLKCKLFGYLAKQWSLRTEVRNSKNQIGNDGKKGNIY